MRKTERLRRDMLLERSLIEQRLAEHAAAHGDEESEAALLAHKEETEQQLDALMAQPPTRAERAVALGKRLVTGFRKSSKPPTE